MIWSEEDSEQRRESKERAPAAPYSGGQNLGQSGNIKDIIAAKEAKERPPRKQVDDVPIPPEVQAQFDELTKKVGAWGGGFAPLPADPEKPLGKNEFRFIGTRTKKEFILNLSPADEEYFKENRETMRDMFRIRALPRHV